MTKKTWSAPTLTELKVNKTEHGNSITPHVDSIFHDGKNTYYSFS